MPTGVTFTPNAGGGTLSGTTTATAGAYVVTIGATNGVGSPAAQSFTLTVAGGGGGGPVGTNDTYSNGVGNTQYSVGAGTPATPAVVVSGTVLSNDTGAAPLTAGPASIASTNGGQVAMSSNGSFLYTPAAGFAGPSDTFTYTMTDGNGATDTAVVTINITGVVWYVNAGAGGGGTGRSNSPFNTMTGRGHRGAGEPDHLRARRFARRRDRAQGQPDAVGRGCDLHAERSRPFPRLRRRRCRAP